MTTRVRKRPKKRLYMILAFIAPVILCIYIVSNLNMNSIKTPGITNIKQTDTSISSDSTKKTTICLDPGHGGYDSGTTSPSGVMEKDINLKVALKSGKILEKSGFNVIYTRTTDEMKGPTQKEDLKIRCDTSNNANADIFVSLHCNFDKTSSKTRGTEIWCRLPNEKGEELAQFIRKQLAEVSYTRDRGIKYEADATLYVIKNTEAVAVLVEMGFISNTEDCSFLQSDEGQDKCANAISQGIMDYVIS